MYNMIIYNCRRNCPIGACTTRLIPNKFSRHLSQAHKNFDKSERLKLVEIYNENINNEKNFNLKFKETVKKDQLMQMESEKEKSKKRKKRERNRNQKPVRSCCLCGFNTNNMWSHLIKKHKLVRGTQDYRHAMDRCKIVKKNEQIIITEHDKIEDQNMEMKMKSHIDRYINPETHAKKKRWITEFLLLNKQESDDELIDIDYLTKSADKALSSEGIYSQSGTGNKAATIICKLSAVILFLKDIQEDENVNLFCNSERKKSVIQQIIKQLESRWHKLKPIKMVEHVDTQHAIAENKIPQQIFTIFLTSDFVVDTLATSNAINLKKRAPYTYKEEVIDLRDVMVSVILIKNIRRSQEICTFRLKELYKTEKCTTENGDTFYVCYVSEHKTGTKSKATITLNPTEYDALMTWVKHYRPLVSKCMSETCVVFPSGGVSVSDKCCSKM